MFNLIRKYVQIYFFIKTIVVPTKECYKVAVPVSLFESYTLSDIDNRHTDREITEINSQICNQIKLETGQIWSVNKRTI